MMLGSSLFKVVPLLAAVLSGVVAAAVPQPDVAASASFLENNLLSHVYNGQRNSMQLMIENKSELNITLKGASGSIHDADTGKLLKNLTAVTYGLPLVAGQKTMLPYNFYSELKPKDVSLKVWVNYVDLATKAAYTTQAYDSVVSVVEPPSSWFDLELLYTYAVILALCGGAGYLVYNNYVEPPKKRVSKPQVSAPVAVTASNTTGTYEEDWIPAHHLKSKKAKGDRSDGAASSSGEESGPAKRKSKGKRA